MKMLTAAIADTVFVCVKMRMTVNGSSAVVTLVVVIIIDMTE